jgi:hypothetical protein
MKDSIIFANRHHVCGAQTHRKSSRPSGINSNSTPAAEYIPKLVFSKTDIEFFMIGSIPTNVNTCGLIYKTFRA